MSIERFALIGDPVDQSLSPAMHNAALHAAGIVGVYEAFRLRAEEIENGVRWLRAEGFCGFNVTVPLKQAIMPHLTEIEPRAAEIGAVNTVARSGERLLGFNTDSAGFMEAIRVWRVPVRGRSALVLGAGGAGRAVTHALLALKAKVHVANRHRDKAEQLRQQFRRQVTALGLNDDSISTLVRESSLLVNATPVGMGALSDASPLPHEIEFSRDTVVIDLVYGRLSPLLRQAAEHGCQIFDGLEMLVQQGAGSFRIWTGLEPDVEVMRQACRNSLTEVA
jgi:shikimate dehydrogenase